MQEVTGLVPISSNNVLLQDMHAIVPPLIMSAMRLQGSNIIRVDLGPVEHANFGNARIGRILDVRLREFRDVFFGAGMEQGRVEQE